MKHRQWVWDNRRLPPRVLGFLLRLFLSGDDVAGEGGRRRRGEGGCREDKSNKRGLLSSDVVTVVSKRRKSCVGSLADTLELKLLAMDEKFGRVEL